MLGTLVNQSRGVHRGCASSSANPDIATTTNMGAFHFVSKVDLPYAQGLEKSRAHFSKAGFKVRNTVESDEYIFDHYPKIESGIDNFVSFPDGDFIFSIGTFIYRGALGKQALLDFHKSSLSLPAPEDMHGHFTLVMRRKGETVLFRDRMGSQGVFLAGGGRCVSSSFLAAAYACDQLTISDQEIYEYAFGGCTLGNGTPFKEVVRLDLFTHLVFNPIAIPVVRRHVICPPLSRERYGTLVQQNTENLGRYIAILGNLFGDNIQLSQSGGYDSRLLAALCRQHDINPALFVYGPAGAPDVEIPKAMSQSEGLNFRHADKDKMIVFGPEKFAAVVERNFREEDSLDFNGVMRSGAEIIERHRRSQGGALHVNGGGGEVFRNFFNLLDRGVTTRQFVWMFFSRLDPSSCTDAFVQAQYEEKLSAKVSALLDLEDDRLNRDQVECLYPYFRCRAWFGQDNGINGRYGYSVLPFFDAAIVDQALRVPPQYKNFGNFESAMIRTADPKLAAYDSIYGYNFLKDAPLVPTAKMLATYLRPFWLRRRSFEIKAKLEATPKRPLLLTEPYLSQVIDLKFPYMSRFFDMSRIKSNPQFARICSLEYLFQHFAAR
ncbi:MAG: hypothetical protein ACTHLR_00650 [Rhizomicrobium sp.]